VSDELIGATPSRQRIADALPALGFWLSMGILATVGALAYRDVAGLIETSRWVEHTHQVIEACNDVLLSLRDAGSARHAYVLTGDPAELLAYRRVLAQLEAQRAALPVLVADNPTQGRRVRELEPLIDERLSPMERSIAYRDAHGFDREREDALSREGTRVTKAVRELIGAMVDDEQRLLRARMVTEQERAAATKRALLAGAVVSLALLALAFSLMRRENARRRTTERELRRSEEAEVEQRIRFQRLLAAAPDAIVIAGSDGRITLVNDRTTALFGYSREELLGLSIEELLPERFRDRHPGHRSRYHAAAAARPMGAAGLTLLGLRKGGAEFPVEISLSPLATAEGALAIASVRDVTAQREAEVALQEAKERAESSNRELEAFCYSVAHDLRAPLRGIDGFSQALMEDYGDRIQGEGMEHLQCVRGEAQRMGRLIDDLLSLSRVTRHEMLREVVDISALAREVAGRLRQASPDRRVEVTIQDGLTARADPRLIGVALDNLLGNAWKFTAQKAGARIELGRSPDGERPFYVRDNGAGFDMAYSARLFTAFQRLHKQSDFEGSGIGLATVQRVVHRHGGRVWAEATVGQGATFYFTL
jgi:PAS domain S-box-containing protein